MSAPPKTVLRASREEEAAIRAAVRTADVRLLGDDCTLARADHVPGLVVLLADPAVSGPIYDLPRPIACDTIAAWVADAERKRQAGEGLLVVRLDQHGEIYSYSRFSIWPDRASAEIAGAFRASDQNAGIGKAGAARSVGWMFEELGVRLVCVTAALDNERSARIVETADFTAMGERDSVRSDASIRQSLYWEMSRDAWRARLRST